MYVLAVYIVYSSRYVVLGQAQADNVLYIRKAIDAKKTRKYPAQPPTRVNGGRFMLQGKRAQSERTH